MSLRVFEKGVPIPGELVLTREGPGGRDGWRHYLDGLPVATGAAIEWWDAPARAWRKARYESRLDGPAADVVIYLAVGGERVIASESHRFRWPPRGKR